MNFLFSLPDSLYWLKIVGPLYFDNWDSFNNFLFDLDEDAIYFEGFYNIEWAFFVFS